MHNSTIIGVIASILTATSLIPQLVKLIREKKPQDISNLMLGVLALGHGFWIYYGFLQKDTIIIVSNLFAFSIDLIIGILTIKYKFQNSKNPYLSTLKNQKL